jgi:hypothetical protein
MVHRFWQGAIAGTYVGHGETYQDPSHQIWWAKGGLLKGQSPARIQFLRTVMEDGPKSGWEPIDKWQDDHTAGVPGRFYLVYFGKATPQTWPVELPGKPGMTPVLKADVLDTWNMTVKPVSREFRMKSKNKYRLVADPPATVDLPGTPYMAIRLTVAEKAK